MLRRGMLIAMDFFKKGVHLQGGVPCPSSHVPHDVSLTRRIRHRFPQSEHGMAHGDTHCGGGYFRFSGQNKAVTSQSIEHESSSGLRPASHELGTAKNSEALGGGFKLRQGGPTGDYRQVGRQKQGSRGFGKVGRAVAHDGVVRGA